jgi:hypothetical protein
VDNLADIFPIALAEYLINRGNEVELVMPWSGLGVPSIAFDLVQGYKRARKLKIKIADRTWFLSINGSAVTLFDPYTAPEIEQWVVEGVGAIVPLIWKSNKPLFGLLRDSVKEVFVIGDAENPGGADAIANATFTGHRLARKL